MPNSFAEYGSLATHMRHVERTSRRLARTTFYGMARWQGGLEEQQGFLGRIVDIGAELFAISAMCVRARTLQATTPPPVTPSSPGAGLHRRSQEPHDVIIVYTYLAGMLASWVARRRELVNIVYMLSNPHAPRSENSDPRNTSPVVSVRLDRSTAGRLNDLSERTGRSRGFYLRRAIEIALPVLESKHWGDTVQERMEREDQIFQELIRSINVSLDEGSPDDSATG